MKVAIAFLLVALNCYFGLGNTGNFDTYGAQSDIPTIPLKCVEKLIKVNLPKTLKRLQELLCLYLKAKKEHNEELYKKFLKEAHETLITTGCTLDEILSTKDFLEKVGNKVGEAADKLGLQILKLVEELGISDLIMNAACGLLGETLKSLSDSLSGLSGASDLFNNLPLIG